MQPVRFGWHYIFKGPRRSVSRLGRTFTRGLKEDKVPFTQQPLTRLSFDEFELRLSTPTKSFTRTEFLNLMASIVCMRYSKSLRTEVWEPALRVFTAEIDKRLGEPVDPKDFEEVTIELPYQ